MSDTLRDGDTLTIEETRILTDDGAQHVVDRQTRLSRADDDGLTGWFTLRYKTRTTCDCGYDGLYAHETKEPHRVVVWPDALDPTLRKMAAEAMWGDTIPYERAMGPAVSFYKAFPS